jgi:hypothetical protein
MRNGAANDNLISQTQRFWRLRLGRDLSREDARQIAVNMTGIFSLLAEWSKAEKRGPANDNGGPPTVQTGASEHD